MRKIIKLYGFLVNQASQGGKNRFMMNSFCVIQFISPSTCVYRLHHYLSVCSSLPPPSPLSLSPSLYLSLSLSLSPSLSLFLSLSVLPLHELDVETSRSVEATPSVMCSHFSEQSPINEWVTAGETLGSSLYLSSRHRYYHPHRLAPSSDLYQLKRLFISSKIRLSLPPTIHTLLHMTTTTTLMINPWTGRHHSLQVDKKNLFDLECTFAVHFVVVVSIFPPRCTCRGGNHHQATCHPPHSRALLASFTTYQHYYFRRLTVHNYCFRLRHT